MNNISQEDLLYWKMTYGERFKITRWATMKVRKPNKGIEISLKTYNSFKYQLKYYKAPGDTQKYAYRTHDMQKFIKQLDIAVNTLNSNWINLDEDECKIEMLEIAS